MPLQFRRGTETEILTITPADGEPLWATDSHKFFIGDGETAGGIEITGGGGGGGAQGAQGYQGFQGTAGTAGTAGAQGAAGSAGPQGATGSQGFQGNQGVQGSQGATGSGEIGVQGSQGHQGFQGAQGSKGDTGPQGNQGFQGPPDGAQGFQGFQGHQGVQGAIGVGTQGAQGFQGFQGPPDGAQGFQGFQGNQGFQGSQGHQGHQGIQGSQGFQGAQGEQGFQGHQGNQGFQGAQGHQGFQGEQGVQGSQGAQGSQGFTGDTGEQGPQGMTGTKGFQGFQGAQGEQGFQGYQGPADGAQGFQGYQGVQGAGGAVTPDSDATVNSLTVTNLLSANSGTNIKRSLAVGGGTVGSDGYYKSGSGTIPFIIYAANENSNTNGRILVRDFGQNNSGGTTSTTPTPTVVIEGARGTPSSPLALNNGHVLGSVSFSGYDGAGWTVADRSLAPALLLITSAEAFNYSGSTTTNAGTNWLFRDQPLGIQLNSTSRRYWMRTSQTAVTGAPPTLNLFFNDNAGTNPTLTPSAGGTTYTGYGKMAVTWINASQTMIGVANDSSADNGNLSNTNFISLVGVRRSGMSGRRNKLLRDDAVYDIQWQTPTTDSNTGNGSTVAAIKVRMLEDGSTTAYGTKMQIDTVSSGTTLAQTRLDMSSEVINFLNTKSIQFTAPEISLRSGYGSPDTVFNYTTSSNAFSFFNLTTVNFEANSINFKDKSGNTVLTYTTTSNKVDSIVPFEATTATITTLLNLPVLTAEPAGKVTGSVVFADGVTWNPASYSTTTMYMTYWNGSAWVAINQT
jgi:hypothetical protein